MTPEGFLEVTDLKQYTYCSRIPFYRYCLPAIRPVTYGMREGIMSHQEEAAREERRSLRNYGLTEAETERVFDLRLRSEALGLVGRFDLAIRRTGTSVEQPEALVVDYKVTESRGSQHFHVQLAAYALLLEEAWALPVRRAFLYSIPLRRAEEVAITPQLRRKAKQAIEAVRLMVREERLPEPPRSRSRCVTCEFRRFCNDVL